MPEVGSDAGMAGTGLVELCSTAPVGVLRTRPGGDGLFENTFERLVINEAQLREGRRSFPLTLFFGCDPLPALDLAGGKSCRARSPYP